VFFSESAFPLAGLAYRPFPFAGSSAPVRFALGGRPVPVPGPSSFGTSRLGVDPESLSSLLPDGDVLLPLSLYFFGELSLAQLPFIFFPPSPRWEAPPPFFFFFPNQFVFFLLMSLSNFFPSSIE